MNEREIKKHQLYTKNDMDFVVHDVKDGMVYGVLYLTKYRGQLKRDTTPYQLMKLGIDDLGDTRRGGTNSVRCRADSKGETSI